MFKIIGVLVFINKNEFCFLLKYNIVVFEMFLLDKKLSLFVFFYYQDSLSEMSEDDADVHQFSNEDSDDSAKSVDLDSDPMDDSCHSWLSDTTDEPPSSPENKRAKLPSPQASVRLPKQTFTSTVKKAKPQTPSSPSFDSGNKLFAGNKNYCLFCSKLNSKMSRHFERIHSDRPEVAAAFQHPQKSKERKRIWKRLINEGNYIYYKNILKTKKGIKKTRELFSCLYCKGLYVKKSLAKHISICPERADEGNSGAEKQRFAARCILEARDDLCISSGLRSILADMVYDEVAQAVLDEDLLLQFGELLFSQHSSVKGSHEHIRQKLRQLGRLLLEARNITPLKRVEDFFLPSNFPHVVSAVNVVAGYDRESKSYRAPSLAIKLGYELQKICNMIKDNAVDSGDATRAQAAQSFLTVYQKNWSKLISGGALTTLRQNELSGRKKLPSGEDIRRLSSYLEGAQVLAERNLRGRFSMENYSALAQIMLVRTMFFNRRVSTEVSTLKISDFLARKVSEPDTNLDISTSNLERHMCRYVCKSSLSSLSHYRTGMSIQVHTGPNKLENNVLV